MIESYETGEFSIKERYKMNNNKKTERDSLFQDNAAACNDIRDNQAPVDPAVRKMEKDIIVTISEQSRKSNEKLMQEIRKTLNKSQLITPVNRKESKGDDI